MRPSVTRDFFDALNRAESAYSSLYAKESRRDANTRVHGNPVRLVEDQLDNGHVPPAAAAKPVKRFVQYID